MKQVILTVMALIVATAEAWCNDGGYIFKTEHAPSLQGDSAEEIEVIIDYEHGYYGGYTYMQAQQEEPSFMRSRALFAAKFIEGVTPEYAGKMRVLGEDVEPSGKCATLTITIKNVDYEGFIEAIMEYEKGKEYHRRNFRSKYSPFGTWVGNFGDGMLTLGEQVGKWLTSDLKK